MLSNREFPIAAKMTYDPTASRKIDRSLEEIQQIEDRLSQIQAEFRQIRQGMQENGMSHCKLTLGTANMLLDRLAPIATKCLGQFQVEATKKQVEDVRARKKDEISKKSNKGSKSV